MSTVETSEFTTPGGEVDWGSVEAELGSLLPSASEAWPAQKCDYIRRNGVQCRKWAIRGATKCMTHGAQLPRVRQAAEERVLQARILLMRNSGRVAQKLVDIAMGVTDAEAHQVTAARAVLDRAGLAPVTRTVSDVTVRVAPERVDDDIEQLLLHRDAIEVSASEMDVVGSEPTDETEDER